MALALVGASDVAQAGIVNGSFTGPAFSEALTHNPSFFSFQEVTLNGWTAEGYAFVYTSPTASANGVSLISVTAPPLGENFVAIDPSYEGPGGIEQTLSGLTVGDKYAVTFEYAGAQQSGFSGVTTEGWDVTVNGTLDANTQLTNPITVGNVGNSHVHPAFSGWFSDTFDFTASSTSELLDFLAEGGPNSTQPPFDLLANVSLTQVPTQVPEPVTLSLFGAGVAGAFAVRRRKKKVA
jgi:hypothetical protein